ncbi:hypothetical protein GGH95_000722 [Coemansia sp. RSA 1836]|nr:hypothetical protein GGF38_001903 [Coemansia sp. RSA 25]KAJ2583920.1 hypothetical protein GGH95_000722 [Coemansia sp. RSA 1836]
MRRVHFVAALCGWVALMAVQGFTGLLRLPISDKAQHFVEFGVLSVLLLANLSAFFSSRRLAWRVAVATMAVACLLSEVLQAMFAAGRTFQWGDVAANYLGAAFFLLVAWVAHEKSVGQGAEHGSWAPYWALGTTGARAPAEDSEDELDVELDEILVAPPPPSR